MPDLITILAIAGAAAIASPVGGLIAVWRSPTTLFQSTALGFASGVLLATICFEMIPQALDAAALGVVVGGFVAGFLAVYSFDLYIHGGQLAGEKADQRPRTLRYYRHRRPRGGEATVLAGGTSAEEVIEGLSIGIGAALRPGLGLMIGLAIVVDNLSEGLGIGELILTEPSGGGRREQARRILGWTGLIGVALLASAVVGWLFLRDLPQAALGGLVAAGGGGMLYLTITDLVPGAEEYQYQQSAAISVAAGFVLILVLSSFM